MSDDKIVISDDGDINIAWSKFQATPGSIDKIKKYIRDFLKILNVYANMEEYGEVIEQMMRLLNDDFLHAIFRFIRKGNNPLPADTMARIHSMSWPDYLFKDLVKYLVFGLMCEMGFQTSYEQDFKIRNIKIIWKWMTEARPLAHTVLLKQDKDKYVDRIIALAEFKYFVTPNGARHLHQWLEEYLDGWFEQYGPDSENDRFDLAFYGGNMLNLEDGIGPFGLGAWPMTWHNVQEIEALDTDDQKQQLIKEILTQPGKDAVDEISRWLLKKREAELQRFRLIRDEVIKKFEQQGDNDDSES